MKMRLDLLAGLLIATALLAGQPASGGALSGPFAPGERELILGALRPAGLSGGDQMSDEELASALVRRAGPRTAARLADPSVVDRSWAIDPPRRDLAAELEAARRAGRLPEWLASLTVPHAGYQDLMIVRSRYQQIVDTGGWTEIPDGKPLKAGDVAPAVALLRVRLAAEGFGVAGAEAPERFDTALSQALTTFQQTHGQTPDGVLGPATRAALNVTARQRLEQIDANLERWRWLPLVLPASRVEVDIGTQQATVFEGGVAILAMRAIVGRPATPTPMFTSNVEWVVFNPPWNVPASIAANEILPKAARDPGYLARNRYSWVDGHLQQRPGAGNALGRIKFDFKSPFGVYLHDTSSPSLFAQERRTLSHGCMRLEKPRELAEKLLAAQGWSREAIDKAVDAGATRRVTLGAPTPLFVVYRTAFVDEAGQAHFRPDVYGWDAKLVSALARAAA